jgi:hypothetical protein
MDIEWDNEAETLISDLSFDDKKDQEQVRGRRRWRGVEGSNRALRQGKDQEQVRGRRRWRGVVLVPVEDLSWRVLEGTSSAQKAGSRKGATGSLCSVHRRYTLADS